MAIKYTAQYLVYQMWMSVNLVVCIPVMTAHVLIV